MSNNLWITFFFRSLTEDDHEQEHGDEAVTGAIIGMAIGLAAVAGLFTATGSLIVFCMRKGRHAQVVGISVAISAGVMLYVSFIEIFNEAVGSFVEYGSSVSFAILYTTATIFGSIIVAIVFDVLMALPCIDKCGVISTEITFANDEVATSPVSKETFDSNSNYNPVTDTQDSPSIAIDVSDNSNDNAAVKKKDMMMSGIVTCIAVILHNIPEGLVTFFATIHDPTFGVVMCIAIALHNFPEGVAISALIYNATSSKTKAVLATFLAGVAEVLGALIGYGLFVAGGKSDIALGIAMAFSAGIMIFVSVRKLMSLAYRIDRSDKYVSYCIFGGMFVMAGSLLILEFFSSHQHHQV